MSGLRCQVNVGFLFSHGCGVPASTTCMRCAMPLCEQHMMPLGAEMLCSTCARQHEDFTGDKRGVTEDHPSYYYDDYGYYGAATSGSGGAHDANDFTEADGESLRHEDDASFEEDMGGS